MTKFISMVPQSSTYTISTMVKKKRLAVLFTITTLGACLNDLEIPRQIQTGSGLPAVYKGCNGRLFVISEIVDDQGNNLLDSLYSCAKDDTFCINNNFGEERKSVGALSLIVDLGNDWCGRPDREERVDHWGRPFPNSILYYFPIPPEYKHVPFSKQEGSKNLYKSDWANITLSIADSSKFQTYYKYKILN